MMRFVIDRAGRCDLRTQMIPMWDQDVGLKFLYYTMDIILQPNSNDISPPNPQAKQESPIE